MRHSDSSDPIGARHPNRAYLRRLGIVGVVAGILLLPLTITIWRDRVEARRRPAFTSLYQAIATLPPPGSGPPAFVDVTDQCGIDFHHVTGPVGTYFMPEINGTGGALFDCDSDGDLDLYLVNSGRSPKAVGDFPDGTRCQSRLFRQEADGRFTDVTEGSGVESAEYGSGCAVADYDNDGDLDLYLPRYGADRLMRNEGDCKFVDVTDESGIRNEDWGAGAVFFDFNRDGWLDLFVANYVQDPLYGHSVACVYGPQKFTYCGPRKFLPTAARLFQNEGLITNSNGQTQVCFRDVSHESGIQELRGAGFTAVTADFDRNGWPDLYVANDLDPNRLWINQGNGTFRDEATVRGVATNGVGDVQASMGVAIGDVDRDGALDLLCTHITGEGATLFINDGTGRFRDGTREHRLLETTFPHTGWGTALIDLDHDADLDLPIVNGLVIQHSLLDAGSVSQTMQSRQDRIHDPAGFWRSFADRNLLLVNDGKGHFADVSGAGGAFTQSTASGRALLHGDIDQDGDLDLIVTHVGDRARVFRNEIRGKGHWLSVRALDPRYRRDAYNAEVMVVAKSSRWFGVVNPASGYASSNDVRLHFGLGAFARYDAIRVYWPDGLKEAFPAGDADRRIDLIRGEGEPIIYDPSDTFTVPSTWAQ